MTIKRIHILLLILLLVFGWLLRWVDTMSWTEDPNLAGFANAPLLRGMDGYYQLSLAKFLAGVPGAPDPVHPAGNLHIPAGPSTLSLLAVGMIFLSNWFDVGLGPLSFYLGPWLGVWLAIPIFLIATRAFGPWAGLLAAFLAICNPAYMERTAPGWLDTDLLNVTLLFWPSYLFMRFALDRDRVAGANLWIGLALFGILFWWWPHAWLPVTAIFLFLFFLAWLGFGRLREPGAKRPFGLSLAIALGLIWTLGGADFFADASRQQELLRFLAHTGEGVFPEVSKSVAELGKPSWSTIVAYSLGGVLPLVLGMAGLAGWLYGRFREALFFAPLAAISLMGVFLSARFLLFLGPLMALGFAAAITWVWRRGGALKRLPGLGMRAVVTVLIIGTSVHALFISQVHATRPRITLADAAPMTLAGEASPPDALIWHIWGRGHPLRYFSNRDVLFDNAIHDPLGGLRTVISFHPLMADDPLYAARFMRFFAIRGLPGMARLEALADGDKAVAWDHLTRILRAGPEAFGEAGAAPTPATSGNAPDRDFFFPPTGRPLYLLLSDRIFQIYPWVHEFGQWDPVRRAAPEVPEMTTLYLEGSGDELAGVVMDDVPWRWTGEGENAGKTVVFDPANAEVETSEGERIGLSRIYLIDGSRTRVRNFDREGGSTLLAIPSWESVVIWPEALMETVLGRLFWLRDPGGAPFRQVSEDPGRFQLWEVLPEEGVAARVDRGAPDPGEGAPEAMDEGPSGAEQGAPVGHGAPDAGERAPEAMDEGPSGAEQGAPAAVGHGATEGGQEALESLLLDDVAAHRFPMGHREGPGIAVIGIEPVAHGAHLAIAVIHGVPPFDEKGAVIVETDHQIGRAKAESVGEVVGRHPQLLQGAITVGADGFVIRAHGPSLSES